MPGPFDYENGIYLIKGYDKLYNTDANARTAFQLLSDELSWFLTLFIKRESPQVLIIGVNIIQSWNLFMPDVITCLLSALPRLPGIVKASLAENAALIGGACCFNAFLQIEEISYLTSAQNL